MQPISKCKNIFKNIWCIEYRTLSLCNKSKRYMTLNNLTEGKGPTDSTIDLNCNFIDIHILERAMSMYVDFKGHNNPNHLKAAEEIYELILKAHAAL